MDSVELAAICLLLLKQKRKIRKRHYWVHPVVSKRLLNGQFYKLYEDLRSHPGKFLNYFPMNVHTIDKLLNIIRPHVQRQDTNMRKCIPPEERLAVTLR